MNIQAALAPDSFNCVDNRRKKARDNKLTTLNFEPHNLSLDGEVKTNRPGPASQQ